MEFNEYQKKANKTLLGNEQVLTNCALGLAGESGQVVNLVKNYTFRGDDLDKEQYFGIYPKSHSGRTFLLKRLLKKTLKT